MESWYYDISEIRNSPSSKDGVDYQTENQYRKEGVELITQLGQKMGLRYITTATGKVYFHRFFMHHSFREFNRFAIAAACLFLAGKVEETPKKARDFFKAIQSYALLPESVMTGAFGDDSKEELMTMERILLKTIKFDLQVDHPYKFILRYAKTIKGERSKIEKVVQNCWGFINDSLSTTLCLQWEPEIVAIALMDLSCRITKYEFTDWNNKPAGYKGKWWDQFVSGVSLELLESICHQVLDLYSNASAAASQEKAASQSSASPANQVKSSEKRAVAEAPGPPLKLQKTDPVGAPPSGGPPLPSVTVPHSHPVAAPVTSYQIPPSTYPTTQAMDIAPPTTMMPTGYTVPPPSFASYAPPPPTVRAPHPAPYQAPYYQQPPVSTVPPTGFYTQPPVSTVPRAPPPPTISYQNYPPPVNYPQQSVRSQPPPPRRNSSLKVLTDN